MPDKPPKRYLYKEAEKKFTQPSGRGIKINPVRMRDKLIQNAKPLSDALSARLTAGEITLQQWQNQMRGLIKDVYLNEYMLSKGGVNMMTQADYGRIGGILNEQFRWLDNLSAELQAGKVTPGQLTTRARMYIESASEAFERAKAAASGLQLPAYPGDGQTQCRTNCKCYWDIQETEFTYECYWRLGVAEHCDDCIYNSSQWNPLTIPR